MEISELDKKFNIVDAKTPTNHHLTAHFKRSFAHYTIKDRLPVILTRIIDGLSREKEAISLAYGEESADDLKDVIGNISKLKYELQTDKKFKPLDGNDSDQEAWNAFLRALPDTHNSYFSAVWLHAECYMYRRVRAIFAETATLKQFDYFRRQKEEAFMGSLGAFLRLTEKLNETREAKSRAELKILFRQLLKVNLWGNRIDLSISGGRIVSQDEDPFATLANLETFILADDTDAIWACVASTDGNIIVDIVNDNAGYELLTDLCLGDFLISHNLAAKIRFHVKTIPWFVSDVTPHDFRWTLDSLSVHAKATLRDLGCRLSNYMETGHFELLEDEHFWTSAHDYSEMQHVKPSVHRTLQQAHLIVFKGDLNYRKLLGDLQWDTTTPFPDALRGFRPSNLCALRTVKADLVAGLPRGRAEGLTAKDAKWMETGDYGVIQFAPK
ncbi:damage-control phosphatase ARMT1 [Phlebotomus argentipes]|uniref:damage-control phosphatase ARMT1 n=1 Tax=Phlebotomus argentipes TaxID=94469 RepID=UPI002893371C|nr:damage-control phosphatase ARMT1 [Phlebotomus argentipes]